MASVTRILLSLLIFTLPFEQAFTVAGVGSLGRAIGLLAALAGALAIFSGGSVRLRKLNAFSIAAAAFVLLSGASVLWAVDRATAAVSVATYAQLWIMTWLLWQFFDTHERAAHLRTAYMLGVGVAVATVVINFLTRNPTADAAGRYTAFGTNENYTALGIAIAIPMAFDAIAHGRRWLRGLGIVLLPASVVAIGLTGSREGLIDGGVALALGALLVVKSRPAGKIALLVGVAALVAGAAAVLPQDTLSRFTDVGQQLSSADLSGRGRIWKAGAEAWLLHPTLGAGSGNFGAAVSATLGYANPAHNAYLALLVEVGPIGLALFLVLLAAALAPHLGVLLRLPDGRAPPALERNARVHVALLIVLALALVPANWQYERLTWFIMCAATLDRALLLRAPTAPWVARLGYGR